MNVAIGDVVGGKYRLVKLLGEGGMGSVYEAVQEPLNRRCALKVLHASLASDATLVARFKREAEVAASLGHPNIVQVTDFGFDEGKAFLVMDFLMGEPLAEAMEAGIMDPERVRFVAVQVLSALDAAHARDIVHRDLKPDNIFLTSVSGVRDMVKLLDFGIARMTDVDQKMTTTGQVLGTPAYMSPEQARGRAVDHRTDLYSLGVLMYEALTGRMPVSGSNYHELMFAIVGETPTPLSELRPDLDAGLVGVVERAMAKDADARFQTAREMRGAIEALGPISATGQGTSPPAVSDTIDDSGADAFAATVTPAAVPALSTDPPPAMASTLAPTGAETRPATPVASTPVSDPMPTSSSGSRGLVMGGALAVCLLAGAGVFFVTSQRGPEVAAADDTAPTTSHELPPMEAPPTEAEIEADTESEEERVARLVQEALDARESAEAEEAEEGDIEAAETVSDSTMSTMRVAPMSAPMSTQTEGSRVGAPAHMSHMRAHPDRPNRDGYGNRIEWVECGSRNHLTHVYPIRQNHQLRFTSMNAGWVVALDDLRPVIQGDEVSRGASACYVGHQLNNGQNWILDVDADGKVQRVRPHVYCPIPPAVTQCMRRLLEGRQFPPNRNAPGEIRIGLSLRGA